MEYENLFVQDGGTDKNNFSSWFFLIVWIFDTNIKKQKWIMFVLYILSNLWMDWFSSFFPHRKFVQIIHCCEIVNGPVFPVLSMTNLCYQKYFTSMTFFISIDIEIWDCLISQKSVFRIKQIICLEIIAGKN